MEAEQLIAQALDDIGKMYTPLTESARTDFTKYLKLKRYPKKSIIVKEGAHSDLLFYIHQGTVHAYYLKDGHEITDWFAFDHDFINAINSYYQGVPSPHYIEALEDVTILQISKGEIEFLCDQHRCIERLALVGTTKTMLALQQRVVSLQFESARSRYKSMTEVRPDIESRVPLSKIASYLGITSETLSRIRSQKN